MLLSVEELIVWTGLGPFEIAIHSLGLAVFTCLVALQLEGIILTSWHVIFSPLYVTLGLHLYYLTILSTRMIIWTFQPPRLPKKVATTVIVTSLIGLIATIFYVEYATASYLNGTENQEVLASSYGTLVAYLFTRLIFLYRSHRSPHGD